MHGHGDTIGVPLGRIIDKLAKLAYPINVENVEMVPARAIGVGFGSTTRLAH